MMRDLFNESVLKRLAGEEDEGKTRPSTVKYSTQERYTTGTTDPRGLFGQSVINTPQLAAKQANAAMQQEAYNAALQQRLYSEQQGLLGSSYHSPRLFGL
jgi:hypothetical protein